MKTSEIEFQLPKVSLLTEVVTSHTDTLPKLLDGKFNHVIVDLNRSSILDKRFLANIINSITYYLSSTYNLTHPLRTPNAPSVPKHSLVALKCIPTS